MNIGATLGDTIPIETWLIELLDFLPKLIVALITFITGLIVAGPAARWMRRSVAKRIIDDEILLLLARMTRLTVIVTASIIALDQVDFDVTGFLAGLGIAGLTVGFALQDIAKNFIAGVLLLVRQPFKIGETVAVAGYSGSVQQITTRDTVIKTWDGEIVIVPNADIISNPITNYSQAHNRRRTVMIGLGYGQDSQRAMEVFVKALCDVPGVLQTPAPTVQAEALGDSALTLAARFWIDHQASDLFAVHSDAVVALNETAEREGIELPYPIQTVRVENEEV
ncbi:MAG: mechanosensitive ion channel [Anaerolineae bacterium]|nr:mechanosensitive ion channel [Anaerolineae bacterium]